MQEHNFDEILDFLCSGIMSKRERQNVRDELFDHLMCKYETNLAVGMDEEKAAESAINDLGDKDSLKEKLQKVHWYYPAQSLKTAFYFLIVALLSPIISVLFGTSEYLLELSSVASVVSLLFEFAAYFMLRTVSSKFSLVFKFCVVTSLLSVLQIAFESFLKNYLVLSLIISVVLLIFSLTKYICLLSALSEIVKPCGNSKIVRETAGLYIMCLLCPVEMILIFSDYSSGNKRILGLLFVVITVAVYILFVVNMLRISDILFKSDREYKVDISGKRVSAAVSVMFVISFALIFAADFAYSKKYINQSENVPYTVNDIEMEQSEYERICDNVASYGIDKTFVSLMPKSEILKYKNVVNKSEITESAQQLYDYYDENFGEDIAAFDLYNGDDYERQIWDNVTVHNYTVGLGYSENGKPLVRIIKIFRIPPTATRMYKDAVVFEYYVDRFHEMMPLSGDEPRCGDLLVAMKMEENKLYKRDVEIISDEKYNRPIEGFVFDVEPGMIIIYASTKEIEDVTATLCNINYTYYHQKYPVMFPIRDIEDLFIFDSFAELSTFDVFRYNTSNHFYVMPDCEYYVPEKSDKKENSFVCIN